MNRRTFIKGITAAGLATLLPTWMVKRPVRQEINLQAFCGESGNRFDCSTPFCQEMPSGQLFKFATDKKICVRVEGHESDKQDEDKPRPQAINLSWNRATIWKPWPEKRYEIGSGIVCPHCDGEGFVVIDGKSEECVPCDYSGVGTFPGYQKIGDQWINCKYDEKIRHHLGEAEFCIISGRIIGADPCPQVCFRFDGGAGLIVPFDKQSAELAMRRS